MCVAFIALSERTPVKLLVAFNRDEDYARPTRAARAWDDGELAIDAEDDDDDDAREWAGDRASRSVRIVGCRDEKCGGTWLALCASTGKWALLTNAYGNANGKAEAEARARGNAPSRGALVTNYLRDPMMSGEKYAAEVFAERFRYDGFNLIVGDARTTHAHWVGNRGEANARTPLRLEPGRVYGLANEVLDSPWPKVTRGKANMEAIMRDFSTYGVDELPALALEERVLREVLHAPLDAAPPRRARRPATPPREETSRGPTRTVRFEQSIAHASLNDAYDDFEVDIDEDDEETVELVVEQVEAHESECSFVLPGELPGRPNCGTRTSQVILISTDGRCRWREHHFRPSTSNRGHRRPSVSSTSASASAGSRAPAPLPDVVLTDPAVVHAFRVPTRVGESTPIA
tara:strand:- start:5993 stop:7204 length:1212 start_codon:yes stop_codon:yes gene_type:complete